MGKNHLNALVPALLIEPVQAVQGGNIHGGHGTHPQDQHVPPGIPLHVGNLVRRTEEHRAADLIDHHVRGYGLQTSLTVPRVLYVLPLFYHGHIRHAFHKQQAGQRQTHYNGDYQIKHHRQQECHNQDGHIALRRVPHHFHHRPPSAHVIGYLKQDGGNAGHGNQSGVRHQKNQHQQQHHGVHHPRNRGTASVFNIRRRPGNGPGGGDAPKQS